MSKLFDAALSAEGITGSLASLARSIYAQESGSGSNTRTSNAGARGGMQIIPGTFASVADKDWSIDDPMHNARAGIRYLKRLDKMSGGVPELTAAGYYGGPGGMAKARRGVAVSDPRNPKAPNTLQYGAQVVARMGGASPVPNLPAPEMRDSQVVASMGVPGNPQPIQTAPPVPPEAAINVAAVSAADAWQQFVGSLPQARKPVQVTDLNYSSQGFPATAALQPQEEYRTYTPAEYQMNAPMQRVPNFTAFSRFGKVV